jgi:C-terminal processing protease CtpA/Prc
MSGTTIQRDSSGWRVRVVNPGTPADEAGLRVGDVVTSVDGVPGERLDPAELREWMKREGHSVPIAIRRGDRDTTVTVKLRRIL